LRYAATGEEWEYKGAKHQRPGPQTEMGARPRREVLGAWTVAVETATTARPLAPRHTDGNRWSKVRGQEQPSE